MSFLRRLVGLFHKPTFPAEVLAAAEGPIAAAPLGEAEIAELTPVFTMRSYGYIQNLDALDGYLACLAAGPGPVATADWLHLLFDHRLPRHDNPAQIDRWIELLRRHQANIAEKLRTDPAGYRPFFPTQPSPGRALYSAPAGITPSLFLTGPGQATDEAHHSVPAWCDGFMTATLLGDEEWEASMLKGHNIPEVATIREAAWAAANARRGLSRVQKLPDARALGRIVVKLHAYWWRNMSREP